MNSFYIQETSYTQNGKKILHSGPLPELCITFHLHYISFALHLKNLPRQHEMPATSQLKCHANCFYFMKCKCNAKSLLQPVFRVFSTTFTMPGHNPPPTSTRRGKGFTKAETTTLLKAIESIVPIDMEGWNEVHDTFNSKHTPQGVEGSKRKFNKLANKPVPTGNPNMPEDVKLAKSIKGKLFRHSGAINLSED